MAFRNGTLYIAELNKISKVEKIEDNLDNSPMPVVIYDDLPSDEPHGWKYLTIGPDNKFYFQVGAPCNICMPSERSRADPPDQPGRQRRRGHRPRHPPGRRHGFQSDFAATLLQREPARLAFGGVPNDKLNRLVNPGNQDFGFPRCHQGNVPDPQFGWGRGCEGVTAPLALLGPHSAPLGVRFYTGSMFPSEYRNALFIARHGSWNKTKKTGGDIVVAILNPDGTVKAWTFLQDNNYIGRPVDMLHMPDGSLLISDDWNGAVYRLSYSTSRESSR